MSLSTPIQAARIFPPSVSLSWGPARPPGDLLTQVDPNVPIAVSSYAARDFELAYRDVVIAAFLAQVALTAADVFGMDAVRLSVQGIPSGTFQTNEITLSGLTTPGTVTHVTNSSIPLDATATDLQLYARDVLLMEALARGSQIFSKDALDSVAPLITITDAWSEAEGLNVEVSVNGSVPLSVNLFKSPDQYLAARDNILAYAISELTYQLAEFYENGSKLLLKLTEPDGPREPEIYSLVSETTSQRQFLAWPGLGEGRNRLTYNRLTRQVTWKGESGEDVGTSPYVGELLVPVTQGAIEVIGERQGLLDSEYYRQKTNRLKLHTYKAIPLYYQPNPVADVELVSGAIYQPDGVFLSAPGCGVTFTPTIPDDPGHYRLAVYFESSRTARLYGSLNLNGVAATSPEMATLVSTGILNWQLKLVEGRYTVRFQFADETQQSQSFQVRLIWNSDIVFEGVVLYNQPPGTRVYSNFYVLAADGEIGSFVLERLDGGPGELSVGVVEFTNVRDDNLSCKMTASMGSRASTSIFSGQSNRPDCLFFDFYNTTPAQIQLYLDDVNVGGVYVRILDIRRFGAQTLTPNTLGYRHWKRNYVEWALRSVQRSYIQSNGSSREFAADSVWKLSNTDSWLSSIRVKESRFDQAFRVGRPGDIGMPALTPTGLYFDIALQEIRQLENFNSMPIMQAFQPWMLAAGIYVFHEDFWVEIFDPAISLAGMVGDCDFLTADFTAAADLTG